MEKSLERINTINAEITALKSLLTDTDYKALKHADGVMSAEEYELSACSARNGATRSTRWKRSWQ